MADLYGELVALLSALDEAKVEYALCGALALAVHGAPRATKDIDLIARKEDHAGIREIAKRLGYVFEALPMEFSGSGIEVQRYSKLVDGRPLMLDLLWLNAKLETVWNDRVRLAWREGTLSVVSRDGLITLKLTAGRPQDLVDIQSLTAAEGNRDKP
ncbi:MAG: nucleotidyl transferase AbiEii/AbiGii toxin family protein [Deltaproteobacteria bacterium]|nr:nucleotidyl transferase AbiEii/AbiGii toxin family protein [Deltaproteobacteria bacterium]